MSKFFKKGFWVPYENSTEYPTLQQAMEAITKYCEENHHTCTFLSDDRVLIDETVYGGLGQLWHKVYGNKKGIEK